MENNQLTKTGQSGTGWLTQPERRWSCDEKKQVTAILAACYESLDVYGKEPEALSTMVKVFEMVLAEYPLAEIERGFALHLRESSKLPTPADIIKHIDPAPVYDKSVYVAVCKKRSETPELMDGSDWQYIRDYEAHVFHGRDNAMSAGTIMQDNERLRADNKRLKAEVRRLDKMIHQPEPDVSQENGLVKSFDYEPPPAQDRTQKTIEWMKAEGFPAADIEQFRIEAGA